MTVTGFALSGRSVILLERQMTFLCYTFRHAIDGIAFAELAAKIRL